MEVICNVEVCQYYSKGSKGVPVNHLLPFCFDCGIDLIVLFFELHLREQQAYQASLSILAQFFLVRLSSNHLVEKPQERIATVHRNKVK